MVSEGNAPSIVSCVGVLLQIRSNCIDGVAVPSWNSIGVVLVWVKAPRPCWTGLREGKRRGSAMDLLVFGRMVETSVTGLDDVSDGQVETNEHIPPALSCRSPLPLSHVAVSPSAAVFEGPIVTKRQTVGQITNDECL